MSSHKRDGHKAKEQAAKDPNCKGVRQNGSHWTAKGPTGSITGVDCHECAPGTWRNMEKQARAAGLLKLAAFIASASVIVLAFLQGAP